MKCTSAQHSASHIHVCMNIWVNWTWNATNRSQFASTVIGSKLQIRLSHTHYEKPRTTWAETEPVNFNIGSKFGVCIWLLLDRASSQAPAPLTSTLLLLHWAPRRQPSRAANAVNISYTQPTDSISGVYVISNSSLSQLNPGAPWEYLQVISAPASRPCTAFSCDFAEVCLLKLCLRVCIGAVWCMFVWLLNFHQKSAYVMGCIITFKMLENIQHRETVSLLLNPSLTLTHTHTHTRRMK